LTWGNRGARGGSPADVPSSDVLPEDDIVDIDEFLQLAGEKSDEEMTVSSDSSSGKEVYCRRTYKEESKK